MGSGHLRVKTVYGWTLLDTGHVADDPILKMSFAESGRSFSNLMKLRSIFGTNNILISTKLLCVRVVDTLSITNVL